MVQISYTILLYNNVHRCQGLWRSWGCCKQQQRRGVRTTRWPAGLGCVDALNPPETCCDLSVSHSSFLHSQPVIINKIYKMLKGTF